MPKKPDKTEPRRVQDTPVQARMREIEKRYIQRGADKLSEQSPSKVGIGPFLTWAGKEATEKLVGESFEEFQARESKGKRG